MRKPLFLKLALGFLLILLLLSTFFFFASLRAFRQVATETEMRTHWHLAFRVAERFAPALERGVDFPVLLQRAHSARQLMPNVSFYLLDEKGKILDILPRTAELQQNEVDLTPIRQSLSARSETEVTLLGTDPETDRDRAAFSVSPITIAGKQGYLYLVFTSGTARAASRVATEDGAARALFRQSVLVLIVAVLGGLVFFFVVTRRLYTLLTTVHAYQDGRLDERVTVTGGDEVGTLGNAIQQLAERVKTSLEHLRRKDFERRQLIANISHDLRTPIGVIVGSAETLLIHSADKVDAGLQRSLENILKNSYSLNQLIKELFELSKFEAREIQPRPAVFTADELFDDIHRKFESLLAEREIELVKQVSRETAPVYADRQMIERVLFNLIGNALRYTSKGGVITLSADQAVRFRVSDSGIGIPADKINKIFGRFQQADEASAEEGNVGLGLAIVQKIIELHNSTITVTSVPGQGTTFEFTLSSANQ